MEDIEDIPAEKWLCLIFQSTHLLIAGKMIPRKKQSENSSRMECLIWHHRWPLIS